MNPPNRQSWIIRVRPEGDGPPTECRVRRFLKAALRNYGLRAVEISTDPNPEHSGKEEPPPPIEIF